MDKDARRDRRPELTPERVLALAGVAGLLLVGLVSLVMIVGAAVGGDEDEVPVAAASPTPTATPKPTPTPSPTPVPLTPEERAEREAAAQVVQSKAFEVVRLRDYDPRRTLRVLIGETTTESRMAFFFVGTNYIGNDSTDASAELEVVRQRDTVVVLSYGTYEPGDEQCCPSGDPVKVRFKWDGSTLAPVDALPAPELRTPGRQTG